MQRFTSLGRPLALVAAMLAAAAANAAPDHPVITEVFQDAPPTGSNVGDGPVSKDPTYPHAEYIELYLPTLAALRAGLNKDSLKLTFYEVEGDSDSAGVGTVNYRIDLPPFDLDPSNGTTAGAVARPSSGVVVVGWLDYTGGNPPTGLAGTPSTRVALINGGVTSTSGFTFIPINGNQFTGTTSFPVPVGTSTLNTLVNGHPYTGIIEQGSAAYLLVNRDVAGYISRDAGGVVNLPTNTSFRNTLLDGYAGNDDAKFDELKQPCSNPGGIDLSTVLTCTGAFTPLVAEVAEEREGYARLFLDVVKTTESTATDSPAVDSGLYRTIVAYGPLGPSPGIVHLLLSPPELELALPAGQSFDVLAGTTGRPGIRAANRGGNFSMSAAAVPGPAGNPNFSYAIGSPAAGVLGQTPLYPQIEVSVSGAAAHLSTDTNHVTLNAATPAGNPAVVNGTAAVDVTIRALNPTTGLNAAGQPFQATALVAIQGLRAPVSGTNEFAQTSLAGFLAANLGGYAADDPGNGSNGLALINLATNLGSPAVVGPMEDKMSTDPLQYIDEPNVPAGTKSLVQTLLTSAERASGAPSYAETFNASNTLARAIRLNIPSTRTKGGTFVPTEAVNYVDATGTTGAIDSGLTQATTTRGFEVAIVDTNVGPTGVVETGATDDFSLEVRADRVRPGSSIQPGELILLSLNGGLQGADIDTLDVPPHSNRTVVIYFDLDALDDLLGVETVGFLWAVDTSGVAGEPNLIEAFSLAVDGQVPFVDSDGDRIADHLDNCRSVANASQADVNHDGYGNLCDADYSNDGVVGLSDFLMLGMAFGSTLGSPNYNPEIDTNGDGAIGLPDYLQFGASFGKPVGPSGLACAGTVPCP